MDLSSSFALLRLTGTLYIVNSSHLPRLDGKHVVFGSVVEGMDVVKAIEKVGSQSGKTSKPVVIANSGQLN